MSQSDFNLNNRKTMPYWLIIWRTWNEAFNFFVDTPFGLMPASFGCQTQELCRAKDATRRWCTFAPQSSTNPSPSNGRSAPMHHMRASTPWSRNPTKWSFSHQHQFQSIETLLSFQQNACQRMIDNDLRAKEIMQQISRMLNSNKQFSIGRFLLVTHFSHLRSRMRWW